MTCTKPDGKLVLLRDRLSTMDGIAVALSGGLDSSFLAAVCAGIPGLRVLAVTADSCLLPTGELDAARSLAGSLGIRHEVVRHDPLSDPIFVSNPIDRCFFCKEAVFGLCLAAAREQGFFVLADGTVSDDDGDFRPGRAAAQALGVISPLADAGLSKSDISLFREEFPALRGWRARSGACLATRFPPGAAITGERLDMVRHLEDAMAGLGFSCVRARYFDGLAKLELGPDDTVLLRDPAIVEKIVRAARETGFHSVAVDLEPYRTGRMTELDGSNR